MTVAPEAKIAGADSFQARIIASNRLRVVVQFLAVPRDQQQRVVGAGAEHEDRQDALALAVEGQHVVLGEEVDDQRRRGRAPAPRDNSGKNHSTGDR